MSSSKGTTSLGSSSNSETRSDKFTEYPEGRLRDFTSSDEFSNIILIVEDKPIYAHRVILSLASPVWFAMFAGDFKERKLESMDLPEKSYEDISELLKFIYPPCKTPITEKNVYRMLPLADEYQINWLKDSCEDFLVKWISQQASSEREQNQTESCVKHLYLSQLYGLSNLLPIAVNMVAEIPFSKLKTSRLFKEFDSRTLCELFEKKEDKWKCEDSETNSDLIVFWKMKCVEIAGNALKRNTPRLQGLHAFAHQNSCNNSCEGCSNCINNGQYFQRIINQNSL